jgi:hypothetical protein
VEEIVNGCRHEHPPTHEEHEQSDQEAEKIDHICLATTESPRCFIHIAAAQQAGAMKPSIEYMVAEEIRDDPDSSRRSQQNDDVSPELISRGWLASGCLGTAGSLFHPPAQENHAYDARENRVASRKPPAPVCSDAQAGEHKRDRANEGPYEPHHKQCECGAIIRSVCSG